MDWFCKELGISRNTYYKLNRSEGKNINVRQLQRFCRVFDKPYTEFIQSNSDHRVYIWFTSVKHLIHSGHGKYRNFKGVRVKLNGSGSLNDALAKNPSKLNPLDTLIVIKSDGMTYMTFGRATVIYLGFVQRTQRQDFGIDFDLTGASSNAKFATREMSQTNWRQFNKIISKLTRSERAVMDSILIRNENIYRIENRRHLVFDGLGNKNPIILHSSQIRNPITNLSEAPKLVHFPQLEK